MCIYVGDMTHYTYCTFSDSDSDFKTVEEAHQNFALEKNQNTKHTCSHIVLLSNVSSSEFAFGGPALCSLFGEEEDEFKKKKKKEKTRPGTCGHVNAVLSDGKNIKLIITTPPWGSRI